MDLRKERTKKSIINAFLELRAHKPLEKITVKELSELALINKATFYSHYEDIYALAEELESNTIESVFNAMPNINELIDAPNKITYELIQSFISQKELINLLFSGSRSAIFSTKIEKVIKNNIYDLHPEYKNNLEWDIKLTVLIQGCYYAFTAHQNDTDITALSDIIGNINKTLLDN